MGETSDEYPPPTARSGSSRSTNADTGGDVDPLRERDLLKRAGVTDTENTMLQDELSSALAALAESERLYRLLAEAATIAEKIQLPSPCLLAAGR